MQSTIEVFFRCPSPFTAKLSFSIPGVNRHVTMSTSTSPGIERLILELESRAYNRRETADGVYYVIDRDDIAPLMRLH